jgi:8-oxo-dGTP pyrophosphatase MutT (NUDIX family)/protein-tyrosine-phosphatase
MDTLLDNRFVVNSSGIDAQRSPIKTSEPYTKATAKFHNLSHGVADLKTQTTDDLLATADVVIFMNKDVYEEARKRFAFDERKVQVWRVADMKDHVKHVSLAMHTQQALIDASAHTFALIRRHCNELAGYLTSTAWVDVVDKHNHATGLRLPIAWATDRGLWHRGVHVVAKTTDGKYVVGKRSPSIVFAPGMLEISLGGGIDSGEHALQAAQRETHEELGVLAHEKDFRPLFTHKMSGYHPHYNKHTRVHLYVYDVTLPVHSEDLVPQAAEVAELRLLTRREVRQLLLKHRIKHFGRLKWSYQLYNKALAYSGLPL